MTMQTDLQAAVDKATAASAKLHDVVHGDAVSTVTTETGPVKTVAKAVADIEADISETIECQIWEKFVVLIGLSGTTSAIRKSIGPIRENPQTRGFLLNVMEEVVVVARAKGVPLRADFARDRLSFLDSLPPNTTSSMHHDLERGNRLELPWLSGGVAELGARVGVPTPLNRAIADILALYVDPGTPG